VGKPRPKKWKISEINLVSGHVPFAEFHRYRIWLGKYQEAHRRYSLHNRPDRFKRIKQAMDSFNSPEFANYTTRIHTLERL
jgi:hypothetical protein